MNNPALLTKISELKDKFANPAFATDAQKIDSWEPQAKRMLLKESLKEHDGVQYLLANLFGDVKKMDELLLTANSTQLSDKERDRVLDRKELYMKFISFFEDNTRNLEQLTKRVEDELNHVS